MKGYSEPFFILANPRSGSSLFRLILNSHENSNFPPECGFVQWLSKEYINWDESQIEQFVNDLLKTRKIEGWELDKNEITHYLKEARPQSYAQLCFKVYEFYGIKRNKKPKIWGDKNNYYIHHLEEIAKIYPNAKYIWLSRDPRDVCSSYLKLSDIKTKSHYRPNVPATVENIFKEIINNEINISSFLKNIPPDRKIFLTFKDIILNNPSKMNELSNFLGLDLNILKKNFDAKLFYDEPNITLQWKQKTMNIIDESYLETYRMHDKRNEIQDEYKKLKKYFISN